MPGRTPKRIISMNVIHGQPVDGSGKVCIHLFLRDRQGRITEPHVLHPVIENGQPVKQKVDARPTRGRLACDPLRPVAPRTSGNVVHVTPRTDDPRAVSCPKCRATPDWQLLMDELNKGT